MRINRSDLLIASVVVIIIAVVVGFLIYGGEDLLGLSADDTNTLISLLPGVFVLLVAFYAVSISEGFMQAGAVAGVGLAFAFLIHLMDDAALLIPDLDISATDLALVILVVFLVIAVGVAVRDR